MPSRAASRWTCSRSAARDSRSRSSRDRRRLELYELCIGVAPPEIDEIGARIEKNGVALESGGTWLRFQDPFGFRWLVRSADDPFRSSGAIADRWIG